MPKLTKYNAKEVLANIERFRLTTGEGIAAVFTWHGRLASIGPENFQGILQGWANHGPRPDILWPARLLEEIHLVTFSIIILVN